MSQIPSDPEGALPTFIVIGAMKCGTTSFASYLAAHPDVFMTTPKEPRYFMEPRNYNRGIEWYRALFVDGAHARARGEASTFYSKAPLRSGVPERMASVVPDVRLLYLLRDPLDRIRSQYDHRVRKGGEQRPIDQAVVEDPRFVDFSRYAFQLEQYLEHFDRSQILVLWSQDLKARRADTVARALSFIGVLPDLDLIRPALKQEFRRVDREREPTRLHGPLRRVARLTPLRLLHPKTKRRLYQRAGRIAEPPDTVLGPEVRARLIEQLVPDGRRLEAMIGETPPWLGQLESDAAG